MEITPVTPATRTRKVRTATAPEPKAGKPPDTAAKPKRKKPAIQTSTQTSSNTSGDLQQQIAMAAYFLAEQRHFAPGGELRDWLAAETLILKTQGQS